MLLFLLLVRKTLLTERAEEQVWENCFGTICVWVWVNTNKPFLNLTSCFSVSCSVNVSVDASIGAWNGSGIHFPATPASLCVNSTIETCGINSERQRWRLVWMSLWRRICGSYVNVTVDLVIFGRRKNWHNVLGKIYATVRKVPLI